MARDIRELIKEGYFVLLFPNDTRWGDKQQAEKVAKEARENLTPEEQESLMIISGPSGDIEGISGNRIKTGGLIKHWVDYSDHVVTVEGGMMHLAYNLGKPFTLIRKSGVDSVKWNPLLRDRSQRIVPGQGKLWESTWDLTREVNISHIAGSRYAVGTEAVAKSHLLEPLIPILETPTTTWLLSQPCRIGHRQKMTVLC
jgi:hypothetical protein